MKFSYTLAAVFATAAVAAPVAQIPEVPVDAGLLAKLSPDVAALVTGLGLTSLAPGLASTLITLSEGLKVRDVSAEAEVPVDAGLLAKLSPDVAALVTGLGLTSLAPGLASTLITLSAGLKTRQIEPVVHTVEGVTAPVLGKVSGLVSGVVGRQVEPVVHTVEGVTAPVLEKVSGLASGIVGRQEIPVAGDLVAKLEALLAKLEALLAGLTSGTGVAARDDIPVAGDLVAQVEALLAGLTSGTGVAVRQEIPVAGDLVAQVEALLAGLTSGTGVAVRQEIPVAGDLVAQLEALLADITAGKVSVRDVAGVPVDAGLLAKLSPDVAALVTGLGLTTLAPGLAATLITLSEGLKTRQTGDLAAELKPAVEAIIAQLTGTVEGKVVPTVQSTVEKVLPTVKGTVEKVVPQVSGAVEEITGAVGAVGARDVAGVPVDAGLLAKLSPDVAALVTGLGLTTLAPGLASTLITLSEGLKTRQESVVPDIPVDAGLLAKLSPDVAAIVSGLGLTSIAPGLAATLVTLSEGLKTRQIEPVVHTVESVTAPVLEKVSGLASGVVGRDVAAVPVDAGLLAKLSPDVAALVTGLGLTTLAPGLASTLITLSAGLKTRESADPLAEVTKALEAILGEATTVVSQVAGSVGARELPAVGGVVSEVEGVVASVTGITGGGAVETVSKAAGAIPVDAGLLAQLSAPVAALPGLVNYKTSSCAALLFLKNYRRISYFSDKWQKQS
ncbi:hypothetical protein V496_00924 [Pseudogymnoascus sp. VKM F-4515 (FW-2607)]|nr:hypothetical protein V496_00924 [Pseudogymnoascus sp. VKM F-4515 (FW-2607)]